MTLQGLVNAHGILLDNQKEHWLPPEFGREVFRCQVGSGLHGVTVGGDDRDEMGMCVEPAEYLIGLRKVLSPDGVARDFGQYIYRTQAEGVRSGFGDLDLTVYSLRKWMKLALQGNPTVLMPLFVPESEVVLNTWVGRDLRARTEWFVTRQTASRFLGYMRAQREQMQGLRGKKHTNRPELVEEFGFDTKFAYHMCRLGFQGVELLTTGKITLPMVPGVRDWLLSVRRGEHTQDEVLDVSRDLESHLIALETTADVPEHPDYEQANEWLVDTYSTVWAGVGLR